MYPILLSTVLALATTPAQQPAQPGQSSTPQAQGQSGSSPPMSIDGNWKVLCLEKNGQPVADAKDVTVSIKDNVVTFTSPASTAEKDRMKAMRLDFAAGGKIRVTEANADGKFSNTGTGGNNTSGNTGNNSGNNTGNNAGNNTSSGGHGAKTGVYVLAKDYLAVCIHDEGGREGGAAGGAAATEVGKPNAKSYCTVILTRADSSRPNR